MVVNPLWVLAVLACLGGLIGFPQAYGDLLGIERSHSLSNFLGGLFPAVEHHLEHSTEYLMALAAIGMAALGFAVAWLAYVARPELPARTAAALAAPYRLLREKYYVDELYDAVIVRPLVRVSDLVLFRGVDAGLIDGVAVNGTARGVRGIAAHGLKYLQSGFAQAYVFFMIVGAVAILGYLLR